MRYFLATLSLLILACLPSMAQDEQKEINKIKKNTNYLYAMGTSSTSAEDASSNARELLALEIEQWLKDNTKGDYSGYIAKSKENVSEIKTQRGNIIRAFVYVSKKDILPFQKEEAALMVGFDTEKREETPQPAQQQAQAQQQVTQPVQQQTQAQQQVTQPAQQQAQPQQQTQAQQQATQPVQEQEPLLIRIEDTSDSQLSARLTTAELEMMTIRNLTQINRYIADGDRRGKISAYGKYTSETKLFGPSYLFVFNGEGNVLAVMRKTGSEMINLSTGKADAIASYGRCGVVWFQMKE